MSASPVELVREQVIGFDESGQRVVTEEYFIKLQYSFKRWVYGLSGKRQTVFLALAMHEADIAKGYLPLTVYDIVEQSRVLTERNKPTISLRGAQYAINFLLAHNFIVNVGARTNDEPHARAVMFRVSAYAWFGPGNVPPSRGSSTSLGAARNAGVSMQNLHTHGFELSMQMPTNSMQNDAATLQNSAERVCKKPRVSVQKRASSMQTPDKHIVDIDVGTNLLVPIQKQQERKKPRMVQSEEGRKVRVALRSFGIGGRNLDELAEIVSLAIADEWALCARHIDMPREKYQGICYNSLTVNPTATPPCSLEDLARWREEERRALERAEAEKEYARKVAAGEIVEEPVTTAPLARMRITRSESGFVHAEPEIENPDPTRERAMQVWNATLGELQLQMTKATFDTWVKPTFALAFDETSAMLTVGVRNAYAKQWLENRLYGIIERTLNHVLGHPASAVFVLRTREDG